LKAWLQSGKSEKFSEPEAGDERAKLDEKKRSGLQAIDHRTRETTESKSREQQPAKISLLVGKGMS
jgi:hypothetical protein